MTPVTTAGNEAAKIPVLLLKTKSLPNDGYEEYFTRTEPFVPEFVPVLVHRQNQKNLSLVKELLRSGGINAGQKGAQYGGLIFTSQRAVEGFMSVVEELRETDEYIIPRGTPLYTVGPATSRALASISSLPPDCIYGTDTGNGGNLAQFILIHYNSLPSSQTQPKLPLLFLVGEQRRDIIPKTVTSEALPEAQRIRVDELIVYETGVMESFEADFIASLKANEYAPVQWVVVFSPTGCKTMLRYLHLPNRAMSEQRKGSEEKETFIATIGPTTRDYLIKELAFEPDVCASKPSPEGVGQAIADFMQYRYSKAP
ncbi:MAG: hypothetical protein M1835_002340 [Candelina submexicana]|nr:MAG: hypothetical protein M1835_002340 [Candelina submexicana]